MNDQEIDTLIEKVRATVSSKEVMELRALTGAPIMDCKNALIEVRIGRMVEEKNSRVTRE